jgi:hypothetical protein
MAKTGHITYLEKTSVVFGNPTYSSAIIEYWSRKAPRILVIFVTKGQAFSAIQKEHALGN